MAWTDIDFDKIIPGMVTSGYIDGVVREDQISFADYLNQFSQAIEERWHIVASSASTPPALLDITFQEGEIRNSIYWAKIRELIGAYSELWFNYEYFTSGVLVDTINSDDYLISDSDLETAIGVEAYDILVNYDTLSGIDIFKASIFQAFYTIYEKTEIIQKLTGKAANSSVPVYNTGVSYNDSIRWAADDDITDGEDFSSYASLLSNYNARTVLTEVTQSSTTRHITIGTRTINGRDPDWRLNSSVWNDFVSISYLSEKLTGIVLTMEVTPGAVEVFKNYVDDTTSGALNKRAYSDDYTHVEVGDPTALNILNAAHYNITQDGTFGTQLNCSYNGNDGDAVPLLETPDNTAANNGSCVFAMVLRAPASLFVNLNNSALDYYITP
tara:strand:+ start:2335 stop:3489 length:1155 start_codon:yes stop_codon:yes gene_type:complete